MNCHHHSATKDHGHEDTTGDCSETSKTFYCEVEDRSPHHRGAKTYKEKREGTKRNGLPDEFKSTPVYTGEIYQNIAWSKHTEEYKHKSCSRNSSNHSAAAHLATDTSTYKTSYKHHKPIYSNEQTNRSYRNTLSYQVLLYEVRHTYFNAHVEEDSQSTESKVTETECTCYQLTCSERARLFFFFDRLFNLGKKNHNKSNSKDRKSNEQSRRSIRNTSLAYICDESTHKNVASHSSRRVEHTTELNKLVT